MLKRFYISIATLLAALAWLSTPSFAQIEKSQDKIVKETLTDNHVAVFIAEQQFSANGFESNRQARETYSRLPKSTNAAANFLMEDFSVGISKAGRSL